MALIKKVEKCRIVQDVNDGYGEYSLVVPTWTVVDGQQ